MAKTKKKTAKDGMQRILDAAVDEFCRAGLAGAKLDVIAIEAGVSKQLIHHYFRTKSELYIAVINQVTEQEIEELISLDYENCEPQEAIALLLQSVFGFFTHWPFLAGLYNDQGLYGGEHVAECRELIYRSPELLSRLEAVLKRGQASGVFKEDLPLKETIAAALMVVMGYFTHSPMLTSLTPIDLSKQESSEQWLKFSVKFVLDALRR